MADEKETLPDGNQAADTTAATLITKELAERLDEGLAKIREEFVNKQKAFNFHGTDKSEQEMNRVATKKDAIEFIRAVARGDVNKAAEIHNARAPHISESYMIDTKTITNAGSAGSEFLVPTVFETEIYASFDTYDEIISAADVRDYNKPGYIFKLNELDTRVTAFYSDEDSTGLTSSQPSYSEPVIAVYDIIGATDMTQDFLEDTEVDIMSNLSKQFGEIFAQKVQARLINGDYTTSGIVTKGIFNATGITEVLTANPTSGYSGISAQDIENVYFTAISTDHFQNANKNGSFYMNGLTLQKLRQNIRLTTTNKDTLSIFDQIQMQLLSRPLVLTNQAPTPATTVSDPFVIYGNLREHLKIRRKRGITMKVNDSGTSRSGRNLNYQFGRELVVSQRIGHQVVLPEGLTKLST